MEDRFGRKISYLRISVTDRCDLRCRYCMAEKMEFLPRSDILTFEEIHAIAKAFVSRGVTKIRLTGGEPLVRTGILDLVRMLGEHIGTGLSELTMTTNGTQLGEFADGLVRAGIERINVSLDTLDANTYHQITRFGNINKALTGIDVASRAGLRVKINMVALKGVNDHEIAPMLMWCSERGFDLTLIETMPLGNVDDSRADRYFPLDEARERLKRQFEIIPSAEKTGGPARYWKVDGTSTRLGLITPLSDNFCAGCNRVRLTAEGKIYMCLGQDDHIDLRAVLRERGPDALDAALDVAMDRKPYGHDFTISTHSAPALARHMSVTGG